MKIIGNRSAEEHLKILKISRSFWSDLEVSIIWWHSPLKGQCHEIFTSGVFYESVSPKNLSTPLQPFQIFLKIHGDICGSRCTTGVVDTRWQMEKILNQKNCNNLVWTPLGSRVNIYINFCLQIHLKESAAWYCSHYFPPVSATPVANLPSVSLIPVAICHPASLTPAELVAKFATGVNDTGGAPWLANFWKNSKWT